MITISQARQYTLQHAGGPRVNEYGKCRIILQPQIYKQMCQSGDRALESNLLEEQGSKRRDSAQGGNSARLAPHQGGDAFTTPGSS